MKSHGILMKAEMIRAYLAGQKTQTRRLKGLQKINKDPDAWEFKGILEWGAVFVNRWEIGIQMVIKHPYGKIDDEIWFKETWAPMCREAVPICYCETEEEKEANHYIEYRADTGNAYPGDWPEEEARGNDEAPKWRSSMFMPYSASRIRVQVINVHVERLQDITLGNVAAEGWTDAPKSKEVWLPELLKAQTNGFSWFIPLWNLINAKRGMGWDVNPWVWVYEFPKCSTVCSLGYDMAKG